MFFDTFGFYFQDDYRVLPRLTLNLGLRYEFNTQPTEKRGRQSYFADPPFSDTYMLGPDRGGSDISRCEPACRFCLGYIRRWQDVIEGWLRNPLRYCQFGRGIRSESGMPPFVSEFHGH